MIGPLLLQILHCFRCSAKRLQDKYCVLSVSFPESIGGFKRLPSIREFFLLCLIEIEFCHSLL